MSLPSSDLPLPALRAALRDAQVLFRENVTLAPMTHVRIGGPAAFLVEPTTDDGAAATVRACRELEVPLLVLGGGSNLVVADAGVAAVVVSLGRFNRLVRNDARITAGAGVTVPSLMRATREVGLAGLEVLCGIPAVVGGAVAMNAGTVDGETFDCLETLTVVDADGELRELPASELQSSYRNGGLGDSMVLSATFALREDNPKRIFERFEESLRRRNATQPVSLRSVGCVFKNPEGCAAGKLIDEAGCKRMRRGAIGVSTLHANYFVNDGDGTSEDFLALMNDVRLKVLAHSGVELTSEVKIWQ